MGLCPRCLLSRILQTRRDPIGRREIPPAELALAFNQLRIERLLARGGMGLVYKAFDRTRSRPVALKILPLDKQNDVEMIGRFISESQILSSLDHPNIVTAYESGEKRGYLFIIMELVDGPSLRQALSQGPLPPSAAIAVIEQVCDALTYAHERGIIHRDIKPENILLHPGSKSAYAGITGFFEQGGRARLVDFGLARALDELPGGSSPTAAHQYVGTADYIAPESRYGQRVADARGDIYSLGVVFYEMLTGKIPLGHFELPSRSSGSSARLDKIVLRCLASNPSDRFASAAELRAALGGADRRLVNIISITAAICLVVGLLVWLTWPRESAKPATVFAPPATQIAIATAPSPAPSPAPETKPAVVAVNPPATAPSPSTEPIVRIEAPRLGSVPESWLTEYAPNMPPQMREHMPTPQSLIVQYGYDHVVEVFVDGISADRRKAIGDELQKDIGASSSMSHARGDELFVYMAPCRDLSTLAAKIHFGQVVKIDEDNRLIQVEMPTGAN